MEKNVISVNPVITEPTGEMERLSTCGILRGSLSASRGDGKSIPNYLRPARSSYHDYCKYGRRRDFEGDIRSSSLNNLGKMVCHEDSYQANDLNPDERRQRLAIKKKTTLQDKPKAIKHTALSQFMEPRWTKEPINFNLQHPLTPYKIASGKQETLSMDLESGAKNYLQARKFSHSPRFIDHNLSSDNKNDTAGRYRFIRKEPASSPLQKAYPSVKPIVHKKISIKSNTKPDKHKKINQRALVPSKMVDTSAKPAMHLKTNKSSKRRIPSPESSINTKCMIDQRNDIRVVTKMVEQNLLEPQMPSLSCKAADNGLSSLKPRKYSHEELPNIMMNQEVAIEKAGDQENNEEKTIYVIQPAIKSSNSNDLQERWPDEENDDFVSMTQTSVMPENADLVSPLHKCPLSKCLHLYVLEKKLPNANRYLDYLHQNMICDWSSQSTSYDEEETEASEYTFTESRELESETEETKSNSDSKSSNSEESGLREIHTVQPEKNNTAGYKSWFRGTVIANSTESNDPRRLQLCRRFTDKSGNNGQVGNKSFCKMPMQDAVSKDPDLEEPRIVLRHQDMDSKKDARGLYKNVIEETANKLVGSRKSKVRALVRAFETIISLHDKKPLSTHR